MHAPENNPCLLCKHLHFMSITGYIETVPGFTYTMHNCSQKHCYCLKGAFNNLEYLEMKLAEYEESLRETPTTNSLK
jgi:hypothetical protein